MTSPHPPSPEQLAPTGGPEQLASAGRSEQFASTSKPEQLAPDGGSELLSPDSKPEQLTPIGMSEQLAHAVDPELLAPAGGPEPFYAALAAGADAIYCGMGSFNARRKAANFTDDTFAEACRAAHLAGARVYVTVNIVIKQAELEEALALVARCWTLGADAFIIQDWGLFFELRRRMPEVETHISTQANIHDARACAWCRAGGADRVTLSRELSIAEIAQIHEAVDIDLEVFAHGAICFCYSGVCLLSSFTSRGRSANRGMCAQPCRLPYELVDEHGRSYTGTGRERALCPRDTCTVDLLPQLLDAGAHALKLEGRMKAPDYVHSVVSAYRAQLDDVLAGRTTTAAAAEARYRQLKRCFNRDFTHAYQLGTSGDEMMSYERSNNRGQIVGEVLGSRPVGGTRGLKPDDKRRRAAWCLLRLDEPVGAGDLLELRHDDEFDQFLTTLAPREIAAGETVECRCARAMPAGARVRLIRSQAALDAADAALKQPVARRRAVDVRIRAQLGEPFTVELACADVPELHARAEGFTVEAARTRAVCAEDLIEHVGRMGSSPFEAASFEVELDEGCGMGFSAVHQVRAAACRALEQAILAPYAHRADTALADTAAAGASTAAAGDTSTSTPAAPANAAAAGVAGQPLTAGAAPAVASAGRAAAHAAGKGPAASEGAGAMPAATAPAHHTAESAQPSDPAAPGVPATPELCVCATSLEAACAAREAGAARIYMTVDDLLAAGLSPADATRHAIIPVLDEVCREADRARLDPWIVAGVPVAVGTISSLACAAERGAAAEVRSCIPVHNTACLDALVARGAAGFWLSPELTLDEIDQIAASGRRARAVLGLCVLGYPRLMTSEHCILQAAGACIHDCARCKLRERDLKLKNIDGRLLPVRSDLRGRSHLFDGVLLDATPQIPQLLRAGVSRLLVDGTLMEPEELARMTARARRAITAAVAGRTPDRRLPGSSAGCLFNGIE